MSKHDGAEIARMSRRQFLCTVGGVAVSAGVFGLGGCSGKKTNIVRLKSPLSTQGCTEPTALADKLGYYKEEGIEVEFIKVVSLTEALLSSSVDFTAWGTPAYIVAITKGIPVKWIAGLHQGGHAVITHKESAINTFEDLLGKRIAVYPTGAGPTDISLKLTLVEKGYDFNKDVELVPMDWVISPMSVRQRAVDAGCTCPHGPQMAMVQGWGKPVLSDWEGTLFPGKGLQCGGLVFLEKFMKEKPEAAQGVKRAYLKATEFIKSNPKEAARIMAEDMGGKELIPVMELMLQHAKYTPMTDVKTVQAYADLMYKQGMIKKLPDMEKEIPKEYRA
jgi:ABC-type nitrate/sulfonate/bicarbonate transport system substrate-binding protein